MKNSLSKFVAISSLSLVSTAGLQAQFLTSATTEEAQGYAIALDQGFAVVQNAADFALANASNAQAFALGYSFTNFETDRTGARLFKGDTDQHAVHLRYGHAFGGFVAALQLSYFDTKADADYRNGPATGDVEVDSNGWFVAATGAYEWDDFNFAVIAGMGRLSNDSTRNRAAPLTGDFNTKVYTLGLNATYQAYQNDGFSVTPRARLDYTKVDVDSINESGGAVLNSMDRDWLIGSLELLLGWSLSEQLAFSGSLGWHYDFNNSNTTLSGVDALALAGQITLPDVGESVFKVGLGADYAINANWSLGANASYLTGDNLSAYTLGLGLGYRF